MPRSELSTNWTVPLAVAPGAEMPPGALVGEYRVERTIGKGGMGTVYEAVHVVIEKRVALKVIHRELCGNAGTVARFVQEARAINRIGHPNIVDVFGLGTTPEGLTFLAMELLVGESLAARIRRGPLPLPVPLPEACHILAEITHALEAAHGAGVVHRDLKPDNIFLVPGRAGLPEVKLLDFGIAKLTSLGQDGGPVDNATQPGLLVGTPRYIAPEQARGQPLDGRADIYALGVLAFELLTGGPPFDGQAGVELIAKHVTMRPPRAIERNPDLPPIADEAIARMLEKDPRQRPSLSELREHFLQTPSAAPSAEARAIAARRFKATAPMPEAGNPEPLRGEASAIFFDPSAGEAPPRRGRRWWIPVAALAVVAVGVKIATTVADREPAGPPAEPAAMAPAPMATASDAPATRPAPVEARPAEVKPPETREPPPSEGRPAGQVRAVEPRIDRKPLPARTRPVAPRPAETRPAETRPAETRPAETRPAETRPAESKPPEPRLPEPRTTEPKRPAPGNDDALRDPFAPP